MFHPIPAPGFVKVSGKRAPPDNAASYRIQLRCGFADERNTYTAGQIDWIHTGSGGDVVAVKIIADGG